MFKKHNYFLAEYCLITGLGCICRVSNGSGCRYYVWFGLGQKILSLFSLAPLKRIKSRPKMNSICREKLVQKT